MSSKKLHRIKQVISQYGGQRILVVGDIMLDTFIWGKVSRISPEAPIPVVEEKSTSTVPGGAANVACNIASLGGKAFLAGIIGKDLEGRQLLALLKQRGVDTSAVRAVQGRRTIVKTRIIAHHQHVVRIDREDGSKLGAKSSTELLRRVKAGMGRMKAVIIEDYGKGVLSQAVVDEVIASARASKTLVTVDPKIGNDFDYSGAGVITPNRAEACYFAGMRESNGEGTEEIGAALLGRWKGSSILMTLGEEGMCLFEEGRKPARVETRARDVFDVAGAGDTVIAAMTLSMAAGATLREAAEIANVAAGIVVGKSGVNTVGIDELMEELEGE